MLLGFVAEALAGNADVADWTKGDDRLSLTIREPDRAVTEEERSRIPTVFSVLRTIVSLFRSEEDRDLGLYGAFGYDLAYQFDPVKEVLPREADRRDLVLYLPDELLEVDHYSASAFVTRYDFSKGGISTEGREGGGVEAPFATSDRIPPRGDHQPGEYAELVRAAKEKFMRGDLFEVVPGQVFYERVEHAPSEISRRLKAVNPSPYSFFINLGRNEFLIGASPEMFVRVNGRRVETCPISGTIKRGDDAISDSEQILKLLNSKKDESELTMCSDVDRNDKSRVCEPGSVKVIGRRQIEVYSRLIHTVDHIEGRLRDGMDAFDAFLSHAWAVTVTGAPEALGDALHREQREEPARLVRRRGRHGAFQRRHEHRPDPAHDPAEGRHRGGAGRRDAALRFQSRGRRGRDRTEGLGADRRDPRGRRLQRRRHQARRGKGRAGAVASSSSTTRTPSSTPSRTTSGRPAQASRRSARRSPPEIFERVEARSRRPVAGTGQSVRLRLQGHDRSRRAQHGAAIFGVCLGLQALAEAYGGTLRTLHVPVHGKPSRVRMSKPGIIFSGLPGEVTVGRYHSIFADPVRLPQRLRGDGRDRGWHRHGLRAPHRAGGGGAVPSREHHEPRGRGRACG